VARALDQIFNKGTEDDPKVGFIVLMFPYDDRSGKCNYVSNGASKHDIIRMFKYQINRLRERIHEDRHPN
jgi:hypothetical protein